MLDKIFDREPMYPYPFCLADSVLTKDMENLTGMNMSESFWVFRRSHAYAFYDLKDFGRMGEKLLERIVTEDGFMDQVEREVKEKSADMDAFSREVGRLDAGLLKNDELKDYYSRYIRLTRELRLWGWVPPILDGVDKAWLTDLVQAKLRSFLATRGQAEKSPAYYSLLTSSDSPSEVAQEELARLLMLREILSMPSGIEIEAAIKRGDDLTAFPDARHAIEKHLQEFGWLTYAYAGPAMEAGYLLKVLKADLENGDPQEQLERKVKGMDEQRTRKSALLKELDPPADLVKLLEASAALMRLKDFRKGVYQRSYLAMDNVLAEIAKRLGISLQESKFLTFEEVEACLSGRVDFDVHQEVKARTELSCMSIRDGNMRIFSGEECGRKIKEKIGNLESLERLPQDGFGELKGSTAFAGKAIGTVKIIASVADIDKLETGDILVSPATNPDLIVAMKRAAAFVTDTGGITSHAAIVARELRKPCVVGTKFATRTFKDGDKVEVDADLGIVKKLKD